MMDFLEAHAGVMFSFLVLPFLLAFFNVSFLVGTLVFVDYILFLLVVINYKNNVKGGIENAKTKER